MTELEALNIVVELAEQNVVDDQEMPEEADLQEEALQIVVGLIEDYRE